eukprot:SAG22_NODE_966_length_6261_cov_686.210125_4_plen_57_part_01
MPHPEAGVAAGHDAGGAGDLDGELGRDNVEGGAGRDGDGAAGLEQRRVPEQHGGVVG